MIFTFYTRGARRLIRSEPTPNPPNFRFGRLSSIAPRIPKAVLGMPRMFGSRGIFSRRGTNGGSSQFSLTRAQRERRTQARSSLTSTILSCRASTTTGLWGEGLRVASSSFSSRFSRMHCAVMSAPGTAARPASARNSSMRRYGSIPAAPRICSALNRYARSSASIPTGCERVWNF